MWNDLKPCKHCGGKSELVRVGDRKEFFAYRCSNCYKYHAQHNEARLTPNGAKKVWNRRFKNAE